LELPTLWFLVENGYFEVLNFQQVTKPALTQDLHQSAHTGTKCYVFATLRTRTALLILPFRDLADAADARFVEALLPWLRHTINASMVKRGVALGERVPKGHDEKLIARIRGTVSVL